MSSTKDAIPDPLIEWLKEASPEDWHQVAWNWNWDGGLRPLEWIIRQPNCDRGTALMIYWLGEAAELMREVTSRDQVRSDWERTTFDLLSDIENRYTTGFYTRERIAIDPRHFERADWTQPRKNQKIRREIPEQMFQPTSGETLTRNDEFVEGLPPELSENHVWMHLHHLGRQQLPVRIVRRRSRSTPPDEIGFVLGVGKRLVLLAMLAEDLRPNGYRVLRICDIKSVDEYEHQPLVDHAFALRSDVVPGRPTVGLESLSAMLTSLVSSFPLATLWAESKTPKFFDRATARIEAVEEVNVALRKPMGRGEFGYPFKMPLNWIARVDFGGTYETLLAEQLHVSVRPGF